MLRGPFSLASDLLRQTREFERQLAEVREVRVRKEEREAEQKVLQARILRRWAMGLASLGLLGFLALYAKVLFQAFFLDAPGLLPEAELSVPAGTIRREGETVFVDAFHLDRHEVTIGDYEKFLQAIQGDPDWTRWVPENARSQKTSPASLEPRDWAEMLRRARKKEEYQDQVITRDTPVFAVDFASAATYARWNERRLPTMEEWARAAGGDEGLPYPWGTRSENPPANLGVNRGENHRKDPGDSFLNAAPGESFPGDRGPFGHLDMGGNVSEWAVGPLQKAVAMVGNFTDPEAIPLSRARRQDANRQDPSSRSQLEVIGFRTARDDLKP